MTIYLDMDGVIADFFGSLAEEFGVDHWKQIPNKERSILGLKNTDFFNRLDKFPTSDKLVEFVRSTGDWGICSSPLTGDHDNSAYWKRVWLERMGYMPEIDKLLFTQSKEDFAVDALDGKPNILIDDKPSNIDNWNLMGGIGILYQANEDDLEKMLKKLKKALKNA